jgi:hypothetical protein
MSIRVPRAVPILLGLVTLGGIGLLLLWDVLPGLFPAQAHDFLAAFPLALIAFAVFTYQLTARPAGSDVIKTIILASAFLFWAANQLWPTLRQATLFNDIAIALFVFDVLLTIRRPLHTP